MRGPDPQPHAPRAPFTTRLYSIIYQDIGQGLASFSVKGQIGSIVGFASHMVSVAAIRVGCERA